MARVLNLTRPELKRQRDSLKRFKRYLPMLKLKQQQLQLAIWQTERSIRKLKGEFQTALRAFEGYSKVLNDPAGVPLQRLSRPGSVDTGFDNVAGIKVPRFERVRFEKAEYSRFATPVWVDGALRDLRRIAALHAELDVLGQRRVVLRHELTRALQRVNLFEKVKIPAAEEAIRVIGIHLGDQMAAAVGRARIAKAKLLAGEGIYD